MKFKKRLGVLLFVFIVTMLSAGAWVLMSRDEAPAQDIAVRERESVKIDEWNEYTSRIGSDHRISFLYPERAAVSKVNEEIYEVKYIGPESEENTEITDGYYLSIRVVHGERLNEYAGQQETIDHVGVTTFNSAQARRYETESTLTGAPVEHIVFRVSEDPLVIIDGAISVHLDHDGTYRDEAVSILKTLSFEK